MHRRDALKLFGLALPAASWRGAFADEPELILAAAEGVGDASAAPLEALRTIELEIDPQTQEAAVATCVAISPDGRVLAAGADDHRVRLWNLADGTQITQLREHTDWIRAVAYHPTGKQLVSAGDDHTAVVWDLAANAVARRIDVPGGVLHCAAYRPDGKLVALAGFDDRVRLFDAESGEPAQELICSADDVRALTFSPNNQQLAAAGRDGVVRLWTLADFQPLRDIPAHRMRIRSLAYSPDGASLATVGDDRKLYLWDDKGARAATLAMPPGKLFALKFLSNDLLAMGGSDNQIRVYDVQSRRETALMVGHTGSVAALDFHVDTGLLASAGFDTSVRLWKPPTGQSVPAKVTRRTEVAPQAVK